MLSIRDIRYSIEGRPLFEGASANIPEGHKVGLVGRNGTGKTTLFKLIREELVLEGGDIRLPSRARIGGVAQEVPANEVSLLNTVLAADTERAELLAEAETATDATRIAEVQTRLADIDAWSAEGRAFRDSEGAGVQRRKNRRCRVRISRAAGGCGLRWRVCCLPRLICCMLDEPTNYLDLEGALWLESYLAKYPHTVIIISPRPGAVEPGRRRDPASRGTAS